MKFRLIIDREKEEEVVARVHGRTPLTDELEALVTGAGTADEIAGYDEDGIRMLKFSEVDAFYVEDGKTYAACRDGSRCRIKLHLYELETLLPKNFRRINKSNIANIKHIVRYRTSLSGAVDAVFRGGFSDYVSRRCFAELKKEYML